MGGEEREEWPSRIQSLHDAWMERQYMQVRRKSFYGRGKFGSCLGIIVGGVWN